MPLPPGSSGPYGRLGVEKEAIGNAPIERNCFQDRRLHGLRTPHRRKGYNALLETAPVPALSPPCSCSISGLTVLTISSSASSSASTVTATATARPVAAARSLAAASGVIWRGLFGKKMKPICVAPPSKRGGSSLRRLQPAYFDIKGHRFPSHKSGRYSSCYRTGCPSKPCSIRKSYASMTSRGTACAI